MMVGDATEICIGRQHRQLEADAELRKERVDRSDLDAPRTAIIAKIRGGDVVLAFRPQEWKRSESVDDRIASPGPSKPLEQFLQNQPGGEHGLGAPKRLPQSSDLGGEVRRVPSHRQRPHTGVDEGAHDLDRFAL